MMAISDDLQQFLSPTLRDEVADSLTLLAHFQAAGNSVSDTADDNEPQLHDYAFIVFPMAKAYEGFLKLLFLRWNLLDEARFRSRHLRIGRSFNPDLPQKYRDEDWFYDDVVARVGEKQARAMWQLWLDARNHLFHFFPDDRYSVSLAEARQLVEQLVKVMEEVVNQI